MYSLDDATGMHGKYTVGCGGGGAFFFSFFSPSTVCRVGWCWAEEGRANKSPGYGGQACGRWMMDLSAKVHNGGTGEHGGEGQHSALSP